MAPVAWRLGCSGFDDMIWRGAVLVVIGLVAAGVYAFGGRLSPFLLEEGARLNAVVAILLLGLALGWVRDLEGLRLSAFLRYGLIWLVIILAIALGFEAWSRSGG